MPELSEGQKLRIVTLLAQFETLVEIGRIFKDEYGIDVPPKQIGSYDPTRTYYEAGEQWEKVFHDTRQAYVTEVSAVPIANQGFRLRQLQASYDAAVKSKNRVLANATLRQAAEEVGGALTNERNVKVTRPVDELSPDERRSAFADLIRKAMESKDPPGAQPAPARTQ